jgi:ornithine cyclodeaminase/alanine dehydrogenase
MLVLTRRDLEEILDMRAVLDAVERGLVEHARGTVSMPPRHVIPVDERGTAYVMSAFLGGMRSLAVKVVSEFSGNVERGIPSITGAVLLLDGETGVPLCFLDGPYITAMRTGAASALAARSLSVVDAHTVGIIGTGAQARTQILGLWTVRDIQQVKAYSRTRERVREFCREMADLLGVEAVVADTQEEVVRGSDVVVTATNARRPVLKGEWLEPGVHVNSIGGGPARELDVEVYRRSTVVVDSREGVLREAVDLQEAIAEGAFSPEDIYAELGELVAGMKIGRVRAGDITLFRSVGMALEDAATASLAYERALKAGAGTEVDI